MRDENMKNTNQGEKNKQEQDNPQSLEDRIKALERWQLQCEQVWRKIDNGTN